MGSKSVRNLTYLAVGACVIALMYLIKQSNKGKVRQPSTENATALNSANDTFGMASTSPAAASSKSDTNISLLAVTGANAGKIDAHKGAIPHTGVAKAYSENTTAPTGGSKSLDLMEVTNESGQNPSSDLVDSSPTVKPSAKLTSKGVTTVKHKAKAKSIAKKAVHTAGDKGDFMVVAGSFASKDNAEAQVGKLKKMGYKFAEAVKFENTSNVAVVVARYPYHGGAIAVVKALKLHKIDSYVHKKAGEVYKKETPPVVGPPAPTNTAS